MARASKPAGSVKSFRKNGQRPGARLVPATLLAGVGVTASLGLMVTILSAHGIFMARGTGSPASAVPGPSERSISLSLLSLAASRETAERSPKYPRMPELGNTAWQVSDIDEGSVIGPNGEIIVITPPKPKFVAPPHGPLAAETFGARSTGLDRMETASIRSYSSFDAAQPVTIAALQEARSEDYGEGPFSLVLTEEQPSDDADQAAVPLPETRPAEPRIAALPSAKTLKRTPPALLAYAPQDNDIRDLTPSYEPPAPRILSGNRTAIYDISARTVYMPNGERLEAHSGLGPMRDNPRYVHKKMRGATPPHTYRLTMREKRFHGVEAIRLNPLSPGKIFGRVGLLAHTYMLGPRGDSNGCVSFKDYRRFLSAFKRGEVTQLVVVASLPSPPSRVASR